jgi:hypothetical protein
MLAASAGHASVVSLLLSHSATDRNCLDVHGESALYKSIINKRGGAFKALVGDDECRNGARGFDNGAGNMADACCLSACKEIWEWIGDNEERICWEAPEDASYSFEVGMRIIDEGKMSVDRADSYEIYKSMKRWNEDVEEVVEVEEEEKKKDQ